MAGLARVLVAARDAEGKGVGGDRRQAQELAGTRSRARPARGALSVKFNGGDHCLRLCKENFRKEKHLQDIVPNSNKWDAMLSGADITVQQSCLEA
ncbi:hypothetical protein E2562_033574 [Oryza meyeriana var. granulata]|uniref:Uncharacterized protein n=1 Tax=Oryza meyeriana var. granulata TaxID=110450 RepID=A0A6G1F104_9ORYZ|nr:hypothetical protein E2562_033574 [Oryza meyeriana var. granulata]